MCSVKPLLTGMEDVCVSLHLEDNEQFSSNTLLCLCLSHSAELRLSQEDRQSKANRTTILLLHFPCKLTAAVDRRLLHNP